MKNLVAAAGAVGITAVFLSGCGGNLNSASVPAHVSIRTWWNSDGQLLLQNINQDIEVIINDQNYGIDPMSDAENLINDAQTALASPPPVDPADYKEYLNDVIAYGQTVEAGGLPDANLTLDAQQHADAFNDVIACYGIGSGTCASSSPAQTENDAPAPDQTDYNTETPPSATATRTAAETPAPVTTTPATAATMDPANYKGWYQEAYEETAADYQDGQTPAIYDESDSQFCMTTIEPSLNDGNVPASLAGTSGDPFYAGCMAALNAQQ